MKHHRIPFGPVAIGVAACLAVGAHVATGTAGMPACPGPAPAIHSPNLAAGQLVVNVERAIEVVAYVEGARVPGVHTPDDAGVVRIPLPAGAGPGDEFLLRAKYRADDAGTPTLDLDDEACESVTEISGTIPVEGAQPGDGAPTVGQNSGGGGQVAPPPPAPTQTISRRQRGPSTNRLPRVELRKWGQRTARERTVVPYVITVRNGGRVQVTVRVRDFIPAGAVLARVPDGARLVDGHLVWLVRDLRPGRTWDVTLRLKVLRAGRLCNRANVSPVATEDVIDRAQACARVIPRDARPVVPAVAG